MQDIMYISKSNFKPQVSMNKQVGAYINKCEKLFFQSKNMILFICPFFTLAEVIQSSR